MKITALVENETDCGLKSAHGLSLYIQTKKHKLLFDLGPDDTLFENAAKRGIDLTEADTVIISHGHYDHGGALERFLKINDKAKVYIQKGAFEPSYSRHINEDEPIGLDRSLEGEKQIVFTDGDFAIDDELFLFTVSDRSRCYSEANDVFFTQSGDRDDFRHEQSLIIKENETVLIMGCGHTGVVNIMDKAEKYSPSLCIGGFHLMNPTTGRMVSESLLCEIAAELNKHVGTKFYTCHCTGREAFNYLAERMTNLHYLSCGETIEI